MNPKKNFNRLRNQRRHRGDTTMSRTSYVTTLGAIASILFVTLWAGPAAAEVDKKIVRTWKAKCSSCHAEDGTPRCVNWKEDIAPLFRDRCSSCHSGPTAAAGYDTGSYAGVMAGGSDAVAKATAGDASSLLLSTLEPTSADHFHQAVSDVS